MPTLLLTEHCLFCWGSNGLDKARLLKKEGLYQLKPHHFLNPKRNLFFLIILLCVVLAGGRASLSEKKEGDDFLKRYREYQGYVRAGYAPINKKAYIEAIGHYTKTDPLNLINRRIRRCWKN